MRAPLAALLSLALLSAGAGSACALTLTLDECLSRALARNHRIKALETGVSAAQQEVRIAQTGFLPFLKARGNYSLTDSPERLIVDANAFAPGIPPQDVALSTGDRDQYAVSLLLQQPLFTGGNLTHSLRRARSRGESARLKLEQEKKLLQFKVKRQFNEALSAHLQEQTVAKLLDAKRERLRVFRERFAEGYLEQEEVLLQETDLLFAEAELSRSRNRSALALSRLKQLLQEPAQEPLVLLGQARHSRLAVPLADAVQAGLANRDDLKDAQEQVRTADEEVGVARSAFFPQASLTGSYTRQKETNIARPEVWMLSAQLEWQLFEWGRTRAEVQRAAAFKQGQVHQREELKNAVALEIEELWRDLQDREKDIAAQEKRLKTEEYRVGRLLEKYREGAVKLTEVLDVEAQLIKASNDYLIAINDSAAQLAQLEQAVSTPVAGWLVDAGVYQPDLKPAQLRRTSSTPASGLRPLREEVAVAPAAATPSAGMTAADPAAQPENRTAAPPEVAPEPKRDRTSEVPPAAPPATTPAPQPAIMPAALAEATSRAASVPPAVAPRPAAAPRVQPAAPAKGAARPVALQVGAFKSISYARRMKQGMAAKAGGHRVAIRSEAGLYKVALTGFATRQDAEQWARRAGVQHYQVRSDGGL